MPGDAYGETNFINRESNENLVILKTPIKVSTKWDEPNRTGEIIMYLQEKEKRRKNLRRLPARYEFIFWMA